jgi:hypothetical protein
MEIMNRVTRANLSPAAPAGATPGAESSPIAM